MMKPYFTLISLLATSILEMGSASKTPRIIGGIEAPVAQFPYTAAIHVTTKDSRFFCSGVLLDKQFIITAARCVDGAVSFTIQLGSNKLVGDDPNKVVVATSEYFVHPNYNPLTFDSDIGLIRLRMPVEFSTYLRPVFNLPYADISEGWAYHTVGWGQISNNDAELVENLRSVALRALSNGECKVTYGDSITDNMICAAGNYNEGTCVGDTGSPLMYIPKYTIEVPYGIASFVSGNGCESTDPSGFTRIYPFVNWIVNITGYPYIS